jgi:hypothetical protein
MLGERDLRCGETTRVPIDVPRDIDGITLQASTPDTSEQTLFDAHIVTSWSN